MFASSYVTVQQKRKTSTQNKFLLEELHCVFFIFVTVYLRYFLNPDLYIQISQVICLCTLVNVFPFTGHCFLYLTHPI